MRKLTLFFPAFLLSTFLPSCSRSPDGTQTVPPQQPSPVHGANIESRREAQSSTGGGQNLNSRTVGAGDMARGEALVPAAPELVPPSETTPNPSSGSDSVAVSIYDNENAKIANPPAESVRGLTEFAAGLNLSNETDRERLIQKWIGLAGEKAHKQTVTIWANGKQYRWPPIKRTSSVAGDSTPQTKLSATQSQPGADFLSISFEQKVDDSDRIVLTYVTPNSKVTHAEIFSIPMGNVDAAIAHSLEVGTTTGIITHQINEFDNGQFDFVCATNTFEKRSVYAATNVSRTGEKGRIGSSTTYFLLSRWGTDIPQRIEIPLPEKGPGFESEFIAKSCSLRVWLVDRDGKKKADAEVDLNRQ